MTYKFSVVIERDEDDYLVASVPSLRGCHTQAKSLDVLMDRIREAIELCLQADPPPVASASRRCGPHDRDGRAKGCRAGSLLAARPRRPPRPGRRHVRPVQA